MEEYDNLVECTVCHETFDASSPENQGLFRQRSGRFVSKTFCPHCGEWFRPQED